MLRQWQDAEEWKVRNRLNKQKRLECRVSTRIGFFGGPWTAPTNCTGKTGTCLGNAEIAEVDFGAGNFTGFATYLDLAQNCDSTDYFSATSFESVITEGRYNVFSEPSKTSPALM
jgi:hypothetical protein